MLMWDSTKEDNELDKLHLLRLGLVSNSVDNAHHWLSVDCTNHLFRDLQTNLANEWFTLVKDDPLFLSMCVGVIYFPDDGFVGFEDFICLDSVAPTPSEVITVHFLGIWVDQLFKHSLNTLDCSFDQTWFFVAEDSQSNYHFDKLVPLQILFRRVDILVDTDTRGHEQQVKLRQSDVLLIKNVALIGKRSEIIHRDCRVVWRARVVVKDVQNVLVVH